MLNNDNICSLNVEYDIQTAIIRNCNTADKIPTKTRQRVLCFDYKVAPWTFTFYNGLILPRAHFEPEKNLIETNLKLRSLTAQISDFISKKLH